MQSVFTQPGSLGNIAQHPLHVRFCPEGGSPPTQHSILATCERAGFKPKLDQELAQIVNVVPVVAAGLGVSIVPRSFSGIHFAGVSYVDIDGHAPLGSRIGLLTRRALSRCQERNTSRAPREAEALAVC